MKTSLALALLAGGFITVAAQAAPFAGGAAHVQNGELRVGIRIGETREQVGSLQSYESSVHRTLARSGSRRDLALASLDGGAGKPDAASDGGESALRAAAIAPQDPLVQWLATNRLITSRNDDGAESAIARLTRLEPDNAAAWSLALALAASRGDKAGVDAALARMASSSRSDEHIVDALHAWLDVYARNPPAATMFLDPAEADVAPFVMAMSKAAAVALPSYRPLVEVCKPSADAAPDATRASDCAAAGRLMAHRATSLVGRVIGFKVLRNLGEMTAEDDAARRDVEWMLYNAAEATGALAEDRAAMRAHAADWRELDDEYDVMQRALNRAGLSSVAPPDWNPPRRDAFAKAATG